MSTQEKIIMDSSEEAAEFVTVKLWKSRNGNLYSHEDAARYDGCTHRACETCGEPAPKHYLLCDSCRHKKDFERWQERQYIEWADNTPIYSQTQDKYFKDYQELRDYLEDNETLMFDIAESFQLVSCQPIYLNQINEDYFSDELAEDQELPSSILKELYALNLAIRHEPPVSYCPGKYRIML